MLHKTLKSYHDNDPWKEEQEHPDGPLWLLKPEEFDTLPEGITLENIEGIYFNKPRGLVKVRNRTPFEREHGYMPWGIRGYKDD